MKNEQEHLKNLNDIRLIMESSTRFLSLSGISGIIAGLLAIGGLAAVYLYLGIGITEPDFYQYFYIKGTNDLNLSVLNFFIADALIVLILTLAAGVHFTTRNASKKNMLLWSITTRKLIINLLIPLFSGGFFCFILLYQGLPFLIVPSMLIFYGLALVSASKYTFNHVIYLGIIQLVLGLICGLYPSYGLLFWAAGFGFFHIIYGIIMYYKYEK